MVFRNDTQRRDAVTVLLSVIQRATETATRMLQNAPLREPDDLGFMALAFLTKQLEHAHSVTCLIENEQHRDGEAISRLMIEGMALLLWATKEPERRPRMWRPYSLVDDFRTLRAREADGTPTSDDVVASIRGRLEAHGEQFLSSKAQAARAAGTTLPPDPYRKRWYHEHGRRIELADIFEDIGKPDLHRLVYEESSQWIHWTPRGVGQTLSYDNHVVRVEARSWRAATGAAMSAFYSLRECMLVVNTHWNLGATDEIASLLREATDAVNPTRKTTRD